MASEVWFDPIIDILYDYLDVLEEVEREDGTNEKTGEVKMGFHSNENLTTSLRYIGQYDKSKTYEIGDVIEDGIETKVFDGKSFVTISKGVNLSEPKPPKILPKNCTRCGAPVKLYKDYCEYCGCKY